ncbi:hypothetical protein [Mycolicibacterium xanthum]|nr:hypothetical protein [Mycolicibacterium xanthum]
MGDTGPLGDPAGGQVGERGVAQQQHGGVDYPPDHVVVVAVTVGP